MPIGVTPMLHFFFHFESSFRHSFLGMFSRYVFEQALRESLVVNPVSLIPNLLAEQGAILFILINIMERVVCFWYLAGFAYLPICRVYLQAFHLQLNVMTQETHSAVSELIERCRQS
jgi:hypothetical protein